MRVAAESVMLAGAATAVLAGVGLLRFSTPFARIQVAGKAGPVALLLTSAGAAPLLGWTGAAYLAISAAAIVLTLPIATHLLLRAIHRTTECDHLAVDDLTHDATRPTD